MSKLTKSFIGVVISFSCLANNGLHLNKISFPTGVIKLTNSVIQQASDIYNNLPERNFTRIRILGVGEENNAKSVAIKLAKKRAFLIRDFFLRIGCSGRDVKIDLAGVPFLILFKPKAKYSVSGKISLDNIEQQCFTIETKKQSFFETKSGSFFVFQAHSFETKYGMPTIKNMNICIWEFHKKKDMIVSQVSSSIKNEVLETASTFYIQCYQGDEEVKLKEGKNYKIYLNRDKDIDGFKAYYGKVRDGNLVWIEDKSSNTYFSVLDKDEIRKSKNKKVDSLQIFKIDKDTLKQKKSLLLSGKKMGWINCDRTVNIEIPSDLDVVLDNINNEYTVRLVLHNKNAIVPGLASSNSVNFYKFSKIPSGQLGYLLAYRESGEGYMLAHSQVMIGFIKSINLKPEYKTKQEFEYLIDSFLN
jgi:hypothetical protein